MTDTLGRRAVVSAILALALVGLTISLSTAPVAAQSDEPDLECVGTGGGAAYVTDTGLTVYENDTNIFYGTPGADTISFQGGLVEFTASGTAEARLEDGSGPICLGAVDATDHDIAVKGDGATDVTLSGAFDGLVVGDVDTSADTSVTDFAYENDSNTALSLGGIGLSDGTTVVARDTDTKSELDRGTVDDGVVVFDDLSGGEHDVDVASENELPSAEFRRTNLSVSPQQIAPSESVEVSVDIENVGDASGTYGIAVEIDGEREVVEVGESLAPGEKTRDSASVSFDEPGEYELGVIALRDEPRTQTVTVTEPEANISLTGYDLSTTDLDIDETLSITATAANDGDAVGNTTVPLIIDNETAIEESAEVTANNTAEVTFEYAFSEAGDYNLTVGSLDPTTISVTEPTANLSISDYGVTTTDLNVSETLGVTASVTNDGAAVGALTVPLRVDNETVAERSVDVSANDTAQTTFEWQFEHPGNYNLTVGSLDSTTVTVSEPTANLSISDYGVTTTELNVSETLGVTASVTNDGAAAGTLTVPLRVDNETVAERSVDVSANDTAQTTFEWQFEHPGNYNLTVGSLDPTTVTVSDDRSNRSPVAEYADDEGGTVEADGLRDAIADWRTNEIETGLLREVIAAWRSGDVVN
jgi:hypothetical protein